jgi:hypothetical protein
MNIKNNLFTKDKNSSIGTIRLLCGIFGALFSAYLCICFIANFLNFSIFENIVIAVIILPFLWCFFALWIVLSNTKILAIVKTIFLLAISGLSLFLIG